MTRAATTLADPCTGARRRDFLLGLRHGQLAGAQVPSWCSRHGWTLVAPNELARLASLQLVATRHLEGTRVDAGRVSIPANPVYAQLAEARRQIKTLPSTQRPNARPVRRDDPVSPHRNVASSDRFRDRRS